MTLETSQLVPRVQPVQLGLETQAIARDRALPVCGLALRRGLALHAASALDLTRFSLAWSEAQSLCALQATLLELAAEALADAMLVPRTATERIAVVASHRPTLRDASLTGSLARARSQSMASLVAHALGLSGLALDVATGRDDVATLLHIAQLLLGSGAAEHVLLALSVREPQLMGREQRALAGCFVLGAHASLSAGRGRLRGWVQRDASLEALLRIAHPCETRPVHVQQVVEQPAQKLSIGSAVHSLIQSYRAHVAGPERLALVVDYLIERLGAVVGRQDVSQLHAHSAIESLGLDSLAVVELKRRLEVELRIHLSLKTLIGCQHLADVARVVMTSLDARDASSDAEPNVSAGAQSAADQDLLARIDQLSERELDELLRTAKEAST